jgi:nucleoside-diphosphate-sugar epimerase
MARERRGGRTKLLVLGGTLFVGRHVVEAALARGHEVTVFNRGQTRPGLFSDVEELRGDRDGDLAALRGRQWDAVVDPSARIPRWVRTAGEILVDAVAHYTFISSGSVYSPARPTGYDESAPVHTLRDETVEEITDPETYGGLKVLCERAAEELMPGRVLSIRAGLIVGPCDPTGRFTYWVHRAARGGDVVAPEPRSQPVQFVHARDLADWILDMAERREGGVFNATGPVEPLTMERFLEECAAATVSDARFVWVDEAFLADRGVEAWSDLPLWLAPSQNPDDANFLTMDVSKAIAAGLRFRPLHETVRETLSGAQPTPDAGLSPSREEEILEAWKARSPST